MNRSFLIAFCTAWSRTSNWGWTCCLIWKCGKIRLKARPNLTVMVHGLLLGNRSMYGASSMMPPSRETRLSYFGIEANVASSPPPMEWPITKRGTAGGEASCASMKHTISSRMREVGPVLPRSLLLCTDRPHPRWSIPVHRILCFARVGNKS
jgi:hypothetical protein